MATLTSIQNLRSIGYREVRFPDPHFSQNDVSIPIVYLYTTTDVYRRFGCQSGERVPREPYKPQTSPTTGFEGNRLNCALG